MTNETEVFLKPVQTTRASEEIYNQIRSLILNGELKPGEHLPSERKMMEMMQRSRPTIREAMRMLEREGYIRIQSGSSGAVVQELDVDQAVQSLETIIQYQKLTEEDVLEFRQMMEGSAVVLVAERQSKDELKNIKERLKKTEDAVGNPEEFIRCDLEFHQALAEASHNRMFFIMLQVCRATSEKTLEELISLDSEQEQRKRCQRFCREHQAVVDAIEEGDGQRAAEAMVFHLSNASNDVSKMKIENT